MENKILVIGLILILFAFGLSGCNEIINDDSEFLTKAETVASIMYPINSSNLINKGNKAASYRLEIANYTISSKCEEILDDLDYALDRIDMIYNIVQSSNFTAEQFSNATIVINHYLVDVINNVGELRSS